MSGKTNAFRPTPSVVQICSAALQNCSADTQIRPFGRITPENCGACLVLLRLSDGKRKRKKANAGATSRAPQASRSAAQEGHQDHANRGDDMCHFQKTTAPNIRSRLHCAGERKKLTKFSTR